MAVFVFILDLVPKSANLHAIQPIVSAASVAISAMASPMEVDGSPAIVDEPIPSLSALVAASDSADVKPVITNSSAPSAVAVGSSNGASAVNGASAARRHIPKKGGKPLSLKSAASAATAKRAAALDSDDETPLQAAPMKRKAPEASPSKPKVKQEDERPVKVAKSSSSSTASSSKPSSSSASSDKNDREKSKKRKAIDDDDEEAEYKPQTDDGSAAAASNGSSAKSEPGSTQDMEVAEDFEDAPKDKDKHRSKDRDREREKEHKHKKHKSEKHKDKKEKKKEKKDKKHKKKKKKDRREKDSPKSRSKSSSSSKHNEGVVHSVDKYEQMEQIEPLQASKGANKWWTRDTGRPSEIKWESLLHNAVLFPPAYEPHGIKMLYDGM